MYLTLSYYQERYSKHAIEHDFHRQPDESPFSKYSFFDRNNKSKS